MGTIIDFMSADHQACDDKFALAEEAAYASNWPEADLAFAAFRENMVRHFRREEELLFPALLAAGGPAGPVQVMNMEHGQMSSLLDNMANACRQQGCKRLQRPCRNTAHPDANSTT